MSEDAENWQPDTDVVISAEEMAKRFERIAPWLGDPIYSTPTACGDDRNTWRVWHRDIPGRAVAEFFGPNAEAGAKAFCAMCGESK